MLIWRIILTGSSPNSPTPSSTHRNIGQYQACRRTGGEIGSLSTHQLEEIATQSTPYVRKHADLAAYEKTKRAVHSRLSGRVCPCIRARMGIPCKGEMVSQGWFNVGPASETLTQHCTNMVEHLVFVGYMYVCQQSVIVCTSMEYRGTS